MKKILCICLSSTIQRSISFKNLSLEKVNRSEYYIENASGKAINSARVLNQLEKNCAKILCPIGKNNSEYFLNLAQNDELELLSVIIPGNTRTCWTLLDKNAQTTTEIVVGEPEIELDQKYEIKLLKYLVENLPTVDAVLLAGSRPKIWSDDLYSTICALTHDKGKIFLADYIGDDLNLTLKTSVPDIIKINDEEFVKTFGGDDLKSSIIKKSSEYKNMIIVTRGKKSTYAAKNGDFYEYPTENIKAVNTTACGDSFNAGFLYEYLTSGDFYKALEKGTWCAARNAQSEIPGSLV